jgi:hypothetical protein
MTSFANDIRPLFTQTDVDHMQRQGLDLSSYQSVKDNADSIYDAVSEGSMPPGNPWPVEQVDRFKRWMDEGYPA